MTTHNWEGGRFTKGIYFSIILFKGIFLSHHLIDCHFITKYVLHLKHEEVQHHILILKGGSAV